jgi:hypothetical protein
MVSMARDIQEDKAPSGLPDGQREDHPLGVTESNPEGEGETPRGPAAMPGIPTEGEPDIGA